MKVARSLLLFCLLILAGHTEIPAQVRANDTGGHHEVFKELSSSKATPSGYADLRLTATFKTHPAGVYSAGDPHGTPGYRLLVTIDGQETELRGTLKSEDSASPDREGPEAGRGVMYRLSNTVRLRAGLHRIKVALPEDRVTVERVVTLSGAELSRLTIEPVYRKRLDKNRPSMGRAESFTQGVKTLKLILNGKEL